MVALEILGILRQFEPPPRSRFGPDGVGDARWVHLGIEAAKLALADRDAYLTDPEAREVPVAELLDADRLAVLAGGIDQARAASRPRRPTRPVAGPSSWQRWTGWATRSA